MVKKNYHKARKSSEPLWGLAGLLGSCSSVREGPMSPLQGPSRSHTLHSTLRASPLGTVTSQVPPVLN